MRLLSSFGPIKMLESANRKVLASASDGGYGGDWGQLKDAVRMTIIAPSAVQMLVVRARIRAKCVLGSGMSILKDSAVVPSLPSPDPRLRRDDKDRRHDRGLEGCGYSAVNQVIWAKSRDKEPEGKDWLKQDPCGYSGLNFVVRLPNERPGEIQVNIPEMIYGKEKEEVARDAIGVAVHLDPEQVPDRGRAGPQPLRDLSRCPGRLHRAAGRHGQQVILRLPAGLSRHPATQRVEGCGR